MDQERQSQLSIDLQAPSRHRVETAFSRFPIHRICKKGDISIDLHQRIDGEQSDVRWQVSHNTAYGHPGPLAYKIDKLIIDRRLDEATRPLPELLRLGSLSGIRAELGISGNNNDSIKLALHQNASAYILGEFDSAAKQGLSAM